MTCSLVSLFGSVISSPLRPKCDAAVPVGLISRGPLINGPRVEALGGQSDQCVCTRARDPFELWREPLGYVVAVKAVDPFGIEKRFRNVLGEIARSFA